MGHIRVCCLLGRKNSISSPSNQYRVEVTLLRQQTQSPPGENLSWCCEILRFAVAISELCVNLQVPVACTPSYLCAYTVKSARRSQFPASLKNPITARRLYARVLPLGINMRPHMRLQCDWICPSPSLYMQINVDVSTCKDQKPCCFYLPVVAMHYTEI